MDFFKAIFICIAALSAFVKTSSQSGITIPSNDVALAYIINGGCNSKNKIDLGDQLYNSVITSDYETAVIKSLRLENEGRGEVIANVVERLLVNSKKNTVDYAYKLWNMFGNNIVKDYFPIQFRILLNENLLLIKDQRNGLALNVDVVTDEGDRLAFGDGTDNSSDRVSWKVYPLWENNRVYFKIKNIYRHQYLKLQIMTDQNGDRKTWSSDYDDTFRHQWYLQPVVHENNTLFYIYNREYSKALKLSTEIIANGNRPLWGHNGDVIGQPEIYGWSITPF